MASYGRRRPEESALYDVVRAELETFLARARERDRTVPRFVERELRAYLGCGILAHGFVRAVFASLRRRARRMWGVRRGQCGGVTFVQRFGDALNLNEAS